MPEPQTKTGKRLASVTFRYGHGEHSLYSSSDILAIETEAIAIGAAQERERLLARCKDPDTVWVAMVDGDEGWRKGHAITLRRLLADPEAR